MFGPVAILHYAVAVRASGDAPSFGGEEPMFMRIFALVRDVGPVIGVIALALFVLWQGAERRQSAALERGAPHGMASGVQSASESRDGVRGLAEASGLSGRGTGR